MSAASIGRALQGGGDRLIWKAYAIALRTHLTTIDKLDLSAKAIFVASPLQYGIPAGTLVPNEITNEQLYRKADAVQDRRRPSYSSDGGSYFEFAREYLMSIQDAYGSSTKDSRINKLHEELRALQKHCAEAYLKDVDLYRSSGAAKGTSMNFEAWMSKFGIFYPASRKEQDRVEQKLHEMAENPMEGAAIALASMRLAAETKHYHLGSNMPCTMEDLPSLINGTSPQDRQIDRDKVFYRPQYSISGLDQRVESWISAHRENASEPVKLQIDLENAKNTAWADLGFPHLDQDQVHAQEVEDTGSFNISLKVTGIQAFDVERGFWDINTSRQDLGDALGRLPQQQTPKTCMKTTRLLLGYGAELEIIPDQPQELKSTLEKKKKANILGFPVTSCTVDGDAVRISSGHTAYPVLLAVLAKEA